MKLFRKLQLWWHKGEPGYKFTLDDQIYFLEKAIERNEAEISRMRRRAKGSCCPGCFWGYTYNDACDKLDRQLAVLKALKRKESKVRQSTSK